MPNDRPFFRQSRRLTAPSKRRIRLRAASQADLFAARGDAWVAGHWPAYARAGGGDHRSSPLQAWAATFHDLKPPVRFLLAVICLEVEHGAGKASIATLARATGASDQTTRHRLDKLLGAGLVMVRLWTKADMSGRPVPLGYEFRILVDEDHHGAAISKGFLAMRDSGRRATQGVRCP